MPDVTFARSMGFAWGVLFGMALMRDSIFGMALAVLSCVILGYFEYVVLDRDSVYRSK